jgi:hypothetical protein
VKIHHGSYAETLCQESLFSLQTVVYYFASESCFCFLATIERAKSYGPPGIGPSVYGVTKRLPAGECQDETNAFGQRNKLHPGRRNSGRNCPGFCPGQRYVRNAY